MKKIFTFLLAGVLALGSYAQTTVDVVTGAGYANEAYYSFTGGTTQTFDRMSWDISFPTDNYDISVLANNGALVELYTYPNGDLTNWATVDTSNIANWPQMYNSIVDWGDGAFMQNIDTTNQFDFGWGQYNTSNHHIVGDSIYIIKTTAGNYKKLAILDRDPNSGGNTWEFKYANIDGSNEHTDTIHADQYTAKNHISFSLETGLIVENEPASSNWELLFTKYYDPPIPYYVTGVLNNSTRVSVQEVDGVPSATYETFTETEFTDTISQIGYDWKEFDMGSMSYVLDSDRVFFIKVMNETYTDSTYYKIYFTDFGGSSDGKYTFNQKKLQGSSSIGELNEIPMLEVFPNPASDRINIVYDIKNNVNIQIVDLSGKILYQTQTKTCGFNKQIIDISQLQTGIYTLIFKSDNAISYRKFIKQ